MDRDTQVALVRRLFGFLDARTTELAAAPYRNPVTVYTSPARLARERQVLFAREPLFVGLSRDVAAPGDFIVHAETGVPIVVVRTREGGLHALHGTCRHRGAQIVSGSGHVPGRFTCPYHGWTYDDAGRLVAQPCAEGFAGVAPESLSLRRLPVAERHGMIFARASGDEPIDVDAHLAGAERELAALDLGRYTCFARHEIERVMNWKLVIDTFLEAYHVTTLHGPTLGPSILGSTAAWDAFGRGGRLVAMRRTLSGLRTRPEREWELLPHAVVLYNLFPNTMLIHQIDHVEMVQAHPGAGTDSARIAFALYTPEPATSEAARRHFQANFDLLLRTVEQEDFVLGEQIQRGFHSGGNEAVVYGRNEPGLAHYHRMLADALGEPAA
ncbi:MAG TPA: SRPBCC family protein [Candidatus Binatia bacterium]|nr:SRPBCC family protein [Candidatus Binatia bacterium]